MKKLFVLLFTVVAFVAGAAQSESVQELLGKVRADLPKGWTANYSENTSLLEVARDEQVLATSALPDSSTNQVPELRKYAFSFRIAKAISTDEYIRLSTQNTQLKRATKPVHDTLVRRGVPQKEGEFSPRDDIERKVVERYKTLKKAEHVLPDYYFKDISLRWQSNSPEKPEIKVKDKKLAAECTAAREGVVKLLTKYE